MPADELRLHARGMELGSVTLQGPDGPVEIRHEMAGEDQVAFRTSAPLVSGEHTLAIDFARPFDTQAVGLYRMEQDGLGYAFTQFEAADARGAYRVSTSPASRSPGSSR